ncbi:TetR/AcrR family transcriptional regulator [Streptomonospora wellingtoniae]|uniref:TetR family transcriptional regulator n=1 Tax=Streptomonospora wellingtoniae TaxID=3075544 RepID=A0ABU2KR74_9ACTN|nr:TetR family transcriptional regulator [Streptomonospora sp. DSM 45055]MDT0301786.1 TetR family transcriptional regulator [Streptomonospora sp. DSM 45055]
MTTGDAEGDADGADRRPGGRRPGRSGTKEAILAAAREQFADKGYTGATFRGIAAQAGVDPALVRHFYGTKDQLFAATLALPGEMLRRLQQSFEGDPEDLGERFARAYLGLWEEPETAPALKAMMRTALTTEQTADLMRDFLQARILGGVAEQLGDDRPHLRAVLAGTHLVGVAVARHVVGVEPVASLDFDDLVALLAPNLQSYLTGDLPEHARHP